MTGHKWINCGARGKNKKFKNKKKNKRSISHSTSSPCRPDPNELPKPRRYECIIIPGCTNYPSHPNRGFAGWQLCSGCVAVQGNSDKRPGAETASVTVTQEEKGWFSDAVMRLVGRTVQKREMRPRVARRRWTITQQRLLAFFFFFSVRTFENFPGFATCICCCCCFEGKSLKGRL